MPPTCNHNCEAFQADVNEVKEQLGEIYEFLMGEMKSNGKPGLLQRMQDIEKEQVKLRTIYKSVLAVLGTLGVGAATALIGKLILYVAGLG